MKQKLLVYIPMLQCSQDLHKHSSILYIVLASLQEVQHILLPAVAKYTNSPNFEGSSYLARLQSESTTNLEKLLSKLVRVLHTLSGSWKHDCSNCLLLLCYFKRCKVAIATEPKLVAICTHSC